MMLSPALLEETKSDLRPTVDKVISGTRITTDEAVKLYYEAPLGLIAALANGIRERLHGHKTFFNRNFHIEPTNKCVFDCKFCAYSRNFQQHEDAWELNREQMLDIVRKYENEPVTEVHIVGGVHPKMNLMFFAELIREIKQMRPDIHVKAFTAVELEYMFRKAKVSTEEGVRILKEHGLNSIPGGGAEIFAAHIRQKICKDKADADEWLRIHETVHRQGMHSNCTMLYGHIESYEDRVDHMNRLRALQDKTKGFNCFIPLKFRNGDNEMSNIPEVSVVEDMRAYAMARIFMDNIPHLKAYWPMIGRNNAQLLLSFGVDDLDGTIDDSTKIYSMAGAEEQSPRLSTEELVKLIRDVNRRPVERDSLYNEVKDYTGVVFENEAKPMLYN